MNASSHSFPIRVYYEDTDAGGVVYYANYLKFAERARTEWLRAVGLHQSELARDDGVLFMVRRCTMDFLASARLDDALRVQSHLKEMGKVRMTMQQSIFSWRKTAYRNRTGNRLRRHQRKTRTVAAQNILCAWGSRLRGTIIIMLRT